MINQSPASEPLILDYDQEKDILTVEGIKFHGSFFRKFSGEPTPENEWLKIVRDDNGYVLMSLTQGRIVND